MVYLVCITLALLVGFVYYPSLEAYFTADDFWHLPRLYQALSLGREELLWQNFFGPWVGKTTIYLFYRPITELTLAFDYLLFGSNAAGYHLTSLIWHYTNCLLVYFVGLKVLNLNDKEKVDQRRNQLVAFLVSIVFAIHPSQAEAVAWILSRADLVGTFFSLISVYAALSFFEIKKRLVYAVMLVSMLLAFGSKELCAGLPVILFVVFFALTKNFKEAAKLVLVPFVLLLVFLSIRACALGTPIGGYVGTQGYILNRSLWERIFIPYVWWKLAHPINEQFIKDAGFYDNCLRHSYMIVAILIALNVFFSRTIYKRFKESCLYFCVVLLLILVNFQVWTVCNSLANSRIFYLLLFPLCLSIANIVVPSQKESHNQKAIKFLALSSIPVSLLLVLTFGILCNLAVCAWQDAGIKTQSMQAQLIKYIEKLPPQKRLAVVNLPAFINGTVSFFVPDFVSGLLTPPLASKNYWDKIICLDYDINTVNMQNLKDLACDPEIELVFWDQRTNSIDDSLGQLLRQSELDQLKYNESLFVTAPKLSKRLNWRISNNTEFYKNNQEGSDLSTYMIKLPPSKPMQIGRDLILTLGVDDSKKIEKPDPTENMLYFSFDDSQRRNFMDHPPAVFELPKEVRPIQMVVPLSQEKSWLAVLPAKDLRVDLPVCYKISDARLVNCDSLKPKLALTRDIAQGSNGYFKPDDSVKKLTFNYSCAHIKGASGALAEISKPNCVFAIYTGTIRDLKPSEHALKTIKLIKNQGSFSIPVSEFPQPAYYQVRIAGVSADGRMVSAFGDPVSMSLFNPNKN